MAGAGSGVGGEGEEGRKVEEVIDLDVAESVCQSRDHFFRGPISREPRAPPTARHVTRPLAAAAAAAAAAALNMRDCLTDCASLPSSRGWLRRTEVWTAQILESRAGAFPATSAASQAANC